MPSNKYPETYHISRSVFTMKHDPATDTYKGQGTPAWLTLDASYGKSREAAIEFAKAYSKNDEKHTYMIASDMEWQDRDNWEDHIPKRLAFHKGEEMPNYYAKPRDLNESLKILVRHKKDGKTDAEIHHGDIITNKGVSPASIMDVMPDAKKAANITRRSHDVVVAHSSGLTTRVRPSWFGESSKTRWNALNEESSKIRTNLVFQQRDEKSLDSMLNSLKNDYGDKWDFQEKEKNHYTYQNHGTLFRKPYLTHGSEHGFNMVNKKNPRNIIAVGHGWDTDYDITGNHTKSRKYGLDFDHVIDGYPVHSGSNLHDYLDNMSARKLDEANDAATILNWRRVTGNRRPLEEMVSSDEEVTQKNNAIHNTLSKYGKVKNQKIFGDYGFKSDFASTHTLYHPTRKGHYIDVTYTKQGPEKGNQIVGYRDSKTTPHLMSFTHESPQGTVYSSDWYNFDDNFDDAHEHLKQYLQHGFNTSSVIKESYNLQENTRKISVSDASAYAAFISKQNKYNAGGLNEGWNHDDWGDKKEDSPQLAHKFATKAQKYHKSGEFRLRDYYHKKFTNETGKTLNFTDTHLNEGYKYTHTTPEGYHEHIATLKNTLSRYGTVKPSDNSLFAEPIDQLNKHYEPGFIGKAIGWQKTEPKPKWDAFAAFKIDHPTKPNHYIETTYTVRSGNDGSGISGFRKSVKSPHLLGFTHFDGEKVLYTSDEHSDTDNFNDVHSDLKNYLAKNWK